MDSNSHGLIIDLNHWRPGKSLEAYLNAGVDGFILRMGGPSRWIEGDYGYQEDSTYRPYMDQAKALGIQDQIGAYIVGNPFEDWHLQGIISNVHMDLINQWTSGGYMPGYFVIDHEVATSWRGATEITCTPTNLVGHLQSVTDQIYKQWRKMVMIYTGRWFIDKYARNEHIAYLDNINKPESIGGAGKQRPMWYAGYSNQGTYTSKQYTNLRQALADLPTPSSSYVGTVLQCGSYSLADLWQFTNTLKLTGDAIGVDASVTWGTWAEYCATVGIRAATPPDEPPVEPPADGELAARVTALESARAEQDARIAAMEAELSALKSAYEQHKHEVGLPLR